MVAKRILSFLIIMMLLFAASCSDQSNNRKSQPLSVFMTEYDLLLKDTIDEFNKEQGKDIIETRTFFIDQIQEYADQLKAELASGAGPDIIAIPNHMIPDLSKYIANGYFYDLNELMENDPEFRLEDYYEPVLNTGLINGGRYFLPYSFIVNACYTTGDILNRYNIDPDTPFLSMDTLSQLASAFADMNQEEGKYLMGEFDIYSSCISAMSDILYHKTTVDSARAADLLDWYKAIREVMSPLTQMGADSSQRLKDGEVSFLNYPVYGFFSISEPYAAFQSHVVPEMCSIAFNKEDEVIVQPKDIIAINANCSDKETAYKLIKRLLSKEAQSYIFMNGLPVNKEAYAVQKENYLKDSQSSGMELQFAEKLVKELDDLLTGTITSIMLDNDALTLLKNETSAFLEGAKSSEEAVAAMEQKLAEYREKPIYISEEALSEVQKQNENLPELTVWYMEYDRSVKNAIRSFQESRQDIKIVSKESPSSSYHDSITKMTAEIMAGEGPDIICFRPQMFNSLYKAMKSGAFCDLNQLIANDDTFGNLELNQTVLESGVYGGKRYFIPRRYGMPFLVSTQGILDRNGVKIKDDWTLEDLKNAVFDYASRSGNRYFFSSNMNFFYLLYFSGRTSFIDYETSQCDFQSEEFIGLMELYKDIHPYIMPYDEAPNAEIPAVSLQNNRFVMDVDVSLSPENLFSLNSIYNAVLDEDMVLYPLPTIDGGADRPIIISDAVAISEKCGNKQAALDFIEELLSVNAQAAYDEYWNSNITAGLPVNQEALRKDMDFLVNADTTGWTISVGTKMFTPLPLSETLATRMTQLVDKVKKIPIRDNVVYEIINEGVQSFIDGKRTAKQAAKDIDDKVRLFLNE